MPQELVRRVLDLGNTPVPERYPGYRRGTLDLSEECGQVNSQLVLAGIQNVFGDFFAQYRV